MKKLIRLADRLLAPRKSELDRILGIETTRRLTSRFIRSGRAEDADNLGYSATPPEIVRRVLGKLPTEGSHFLDVGCGKGAVLAAVRDLQFATIRGVELSPRLSRIARKNIARAKILAEVIEADAAQVSLLPGVNIVWFYHGCTAKAQARIIAHFEKEVEDTAKFMLLVYVNPVHASLWDGSPALRRQLALRGRLSTRNSGTIQTDFSVIVWASRNFPEPADPSCNAELRLTVAGTACEIDLPVECLDDQRASTA
jgi:SAM-dependent methyltransferase